MLQLFIFMSRMSVKRKNMSLAEKKALIESYEKSSLSKAAFAKLHEIPRTTINNILISKSSTEELKNSKRKQQRVSPFYEIEQSLLIWIKKSQITMYANIVLHLKRKDSKIAAELEKSNFNASNG